MYFYDGKILYVVGLHVKTRHVRSGQVRSGLQATGEPVLGPTRKKHPFCTTVINMRQKVSNKLKCDFHTTSSGAGSLHIHLNTLKTKKIDCHGFDRPYVPGCWLRYD